LFKIFNGVILIKKIIKFTLIFSLILINVFPIHAFATEKVPLWEDAEFSEEELAELYSLGTEFVANERATGLIQHGRIAVSNSGTTLLILGEVYCTTEVKKCGFKEIVVQKRTTANGEWVNIFTYEDLYVDSDVYGVQKTLGVVAGYDYRVTCIYYAKKNIFSVQKIEAVSNIVEL